MPTTNTELKSNHTFPLIFYVKLPLFYIEVSAVVEKKINRNVELFYSTMTPVREKLHQTIIRGIVTYKVLLTRLVFNKINKKEHMQTS